VKANLLGQVKGTQATVSDCDRAPQTATSLAGFQYLFVQNLEQKEPLRLDILMS